MEIILAWFAAIYLKSYSINSENMLPTLRPLQSIQCSRLPYGFSRYSFEWFSLPIAERIFARPPDRGDLVAFRLPKNPEITHLKRVVGLPGERIAMIHGMLHIDGLPVTQKERGSLGPGHKTPADAKLSDETLPNGRTYTIISIIDDGIGDNTRDFVVPANSYFMLGDNRDNSNDSRFTVGVVPFRNFVANCDGARVISRR